MARTYRCGRCGASQEAMRLPDDWDDATVAGWRNLERRFLCSDCETAVVAWSDSVLGGDR
jgi:hypothetical protein